MRLRGPLIMTGALGLAVLAAGVLAVWMSVSHARAIEAIAVTRSIRINGTENVFAPPPPGAMPAMTAGQAWAASSVGQPDKEIGPGITVHLGLLTSPIGPYCGVECNGWIVENGIAYRALHQLAYAYSWQAFPHRHLNARNWIFVDANTGQMITGVLAREPGAASPRPSRSVPAGARSRPLQDQRTADRRQARGGAGALGADDHRQLPERLLLGTVAASPGLAADSRAAARAEA